MAFECTSPMVQARGICLAGLLFKPPITSEITQSIAMLCQDAFAKRKVVRARVLLRVLLRCMLLAPPFRFSLQIL